MNHLKSQGRIADENLYIQPNCQFRYNGSWSENSDKHHFGWPLWAMGFQIITILFCQGLHGGAL